MNIAPNPLASGNRLQRAYYRWAAPHYAKMAPDLRERVEGIDQFLYTSQGLGAWVGWLCGWAGLSAGLHAAGLPLAPSIVLGLMFWVAVSLVTISAWLQPHAWYSRPRAGKALVLLVMGISAGGVAGFALGHVIKRGEFNPALLIDGLSNAVGVLIPALGATLAGFGLLIWAVSSASRKVEATRLATALLKAERDSAARHAAEADLRLLQAQIHPHFVFNTLATLQHWVDKKDERAGPLLRELTGFLRRSTEMLGRAEVPLAEELLAVRHYLAILGQRMPARLSWAVEMDDALGQRPVPPGLVLTLVENAIEHGLEPKIGGGRLTVTAEALSSGWRLRVADDGLGLAPGSEDGVGLSNIRRRLQLQHGDAARLRLSSQPDGGTLAEVSFA